MFISKQMAALGIAISMSAPVFALLPSTILAHTSGATASSVSVSQEEATRIARDAYVYAYPLVLMDVTRIQTSNFAAPTQFPHTIPNHFVHAATFPSDKFKVVIRPNVDTLYSGAWLDLGPEPVVVSVPASDRYFMLPMLSLWSDVFAVPGTRTTGPDRAVNYLVVGPRWRGQAPDGMEVIHAPTRYVLIIGRTQTNGPADFSYVHQLQRQYKITPLSIWSNPDAPPQKWTVEPNVDMTTPPPLLVSRMDAQTFLERFTSLLKDNPPGPLDYPLVHQMERLSIQPGMPFDIDRTPPALRVAIEKGVEEGKAMVKKMGQNDTGVGRKGWIYTTESGAYGVNYRLRAAVAAFALGQNLPEDAVYPSAATDSEGRQLDGAHRYVWHLDKSQIPPVDAFWSMTAYDKDGYFIPNALKRYAVGDRDKLKFNGDGSLDIYIQASSPGKDKESNWLPVADAPFTLMLRLYSPKLAVLDGDWNAPRVTRE